MLVHRVVTGVHVVIDVNQITDAACRRKAEVNRIIMRIQQCHCTATGTFNAIAVTWVARRHTVTASVKRIELVVTVIFGLHDVHNQVRVQRRGTCARVKRHVRARNAAFFIILRAV